MLRNITESISISDLHEIDSDEYEDIIITVSRRNEPGAGDFSGIVFISEHSNIARFTEPSNALQFIDELQQNGLTEAVKTQLKTTNPSKNEIVSKLHGPTDEVNTNEYIEKSGITNPLNLNITPKIKTTEQIQSQNASSSNTETTSINGEHA